MAKNEKPRGKHENAVIKLLTYRVELSLRHIASKVIGTPMYTDSQYNSIRNTVNRLEYDKKLIQSQKIPLFSSRIWGSKGHFPRGIPTHLRMIRIRCSEDWYCKDGIVSYPNQVPNKFKCRI